MKSKKETQSWLNSKKKFYNIDYKQSVAKQQPPQKKKQQQQTHTQKNKQNKTQNPTLHKTSQQTREWSQTQAFRNCTVVSQDSKQQED